MAAPAGTSSPRRTRSPRELPPREFLDHSDRYKRAEEFVTVARKFWDSWAPDAVLADRINGTYVDPDRIRSVEHNGAHFDVRGVATLPQAPQGHPVLRQAGDSADGRAFLAKYADAAFTLHSELEAGRRYYADVKSQAASYGRDPDRLKVFPAATFVLGDTAQEAADRARHIRLHRSLGRRRSRCSSRSGSGICPSTTRWPAARGRTGRRPDSYPGPRPARRPEGRSGSLAQRAQAENLSIRELVIAVTSRQQFVGTPAEVADEIDLHVQSDACDGFILVPHLTPHGLDEFVDRVVPLLQERGSFRTESPATRCAITWVYRLAHRGVDVGLTQTTVGWLLLAAAALTFVFGGVSRMFIGRRRRTKAVRGLVRTFRRTCCPRAVRTARG